MASNTKVVVLLSGGIDSATCVAFYLGRSHAVEALFVDYGQAAAAEETEAAAAVARHFDIRLYLLQLHGAHRKEIGMIYGRNAFLYLAALLEFRDVPQIIAAGIHAGTTYVDCSIGFVTNIQKLFDQYTDGMVQAAAPFIGWDKRAIWDFALSNGVPVSLTYSCERGGLPVCGSCLSCRDIEALRGSAH